MSLLLSIAYLRDLYRTGLAIAFVVRSVDPTLGLGYTEICRFSQVTLHIEDLYQDLLSPSLSVQLIPRYSLG